MPTQPNPNETKPDPNATIPPVATPDKPLESGSPSAKFLRDLIGEKKKPEPKPPEGEVKPKPIPAKKKVAPADPAPSVIDEEKLGESIGRSIAANTPKPKEPDAPKPPAPAEAADARRVAVMERMEALNPELYKGKLVEPYRASKAKLREYADKWEKEHPGDKFDEEADEHADFIKELEASFDYDDDDYTEALTDIRADKKFQEQLSSHPITKKLEQFEVAEKIKAASPEIEKGVENADFVFWKSLGGEFADSKSDAELNAAAKRLFDTDPDRHEEIKKAGIETKFGTRMIGLLEKKLIPWTFDNPDFGKLQSDIAQVCHDEEERLIALPPQERLNDEGQAFVRSVDYNKMTAEQQRRHWSLTADDTRCLWAMKKAKEIKALLAAEDEKFARQAKAHGLNLDGIKGSVATRKVAERNVDSDEDDGDSGNNNDFKPASPTITTSPRLSAGKGGGTVGQKSGAARFFAKVIGG